MPFFFTSSTNYANNNENDAKSQERDRSFNVHGQVRRPAADAPREEKADSRGSCDEDRREICNDIHVGTGNTRAEYCRSANGRKSIRTEKNQGYSSSRIISILFTKCRNTLLTFILLLVKIKTVTLEAANQFPRNLGTPRSASLPA